MKGLCCKCPNIAVVKQSMCKSCKRDYMRAYKESGKLRASLDKYKKSEKGKAKIIAYRRSDANKRIQKRYRESEEGKVTCRSKLAKYRAILKKACPSWVDKEQIKTIYRNAGFLEVDHIIPLDHQDICGLHVPWNLQYLSREVNAEKSNKFDGTYDNINWKNYPARRSNRRRAF